MRDLLAYYCDLDLPECAVFGLGSGLDALFIEGEGLRPRQLMFGRGISMEQDVARALGIDYREQAEPDDDRAWSEVKREIRENGPVMLSGDVYYLDYREHKVHFPAHRFVLLDYDDEREIAYVADRCNTEPQACSYQGLRLSRNPPEGISTYNLWGRFHGRAPEKSLESACRAAINRTVARMAGHDQSQSGMVTAVAPHVSAISGLAGLERFAESFERDDDKGDVGFWSYYTARCIEDFGTGGGQFRHMFADFLEWARAYAPDRVPSVAIDRARVSASQWTALSGALDDLSRTPEAVDSWRRCGTLARDILHLERELVRALGSGSCEVTG